jgi:hypothetical protein
MNKTYTLKWFCPHCKTNHKINYDLVEPGFSIKMCPTCGRSSCMKVKQVDAETYVAYETEDAYQQYKEEIFKPYFEKVKKLIKTHPKFKGETPMLEKETTYKLTLTDIQACKLLHLLMNRCDREELWDNDLETIYYEMKEGVDAQRFNQYMETSE